MRLYLKVGGQVHHKKNEYIRKITLEDLLTAHCLLLCYVLLHSVNIHYHTRLPSLRD